MIVGVVLRRPYLALLLLLTASVSAASKSASAPNTRARTTTKTSTLPGVASEPTILDASSAAPTSSSPSLSSPSLSASSSSFSPSSNILSKAWLHTRRVINLSNTFGSATLSATPYDRIASHPVFSITTPWGSPYMNMERLHQLSDDMLERLTETRNKNNDNNNKMNLSGTKLRFSTGDQDQFRSVVLYFLDPDDAMSVLGEMKQMDSMAKADIRITSTSLAKALRQATHLRNGSPTGVPVDPLDGNLSVEDGAALRYKIVPPIRQLYYASRCIGKERVGLFADSVGDNAKLCVLGHSFIEGNNDNIRADKSERRFPKQPKNELQAEYAHMEGNTGIPVFYCPELHRQVPALKRLFHFNRSPKQQVPLFFNYEDLQEAWKTMRQKHGGGHSKDNIPEQPTNVEVYNLWDVLTSMERDAWHNKKRLEKVWKNRISNSIRSFKTSSASKMASSSTTTATTKKLMDGPDLNAITFVPSSQSIQYKETISARGNGKARLRPMR